MIIESRFYYRVYNGDHLSLLVDEVYNEERNG